MVHTGSRHLGEEVAEYYTKLADRCLKEQGKEVPYYLSYLEGEHKAAYLEDVRIIWQYAEWNRQCRLELFCATWFRQKVKA